MRGQDAYNFVNQQADQLRIPRLMPAWEHIDQRWQIAWNRLGQMLHQLIRKEPPPVPMPSELEKQNSTWQEIAKREEYKARHLERQLASVTREFGQSLQNHPDFIASRREIGELERQLASAEFQVLQEQTKFRKAVDELADLKEKLYLLCRPGPKSNVRGSTHTIHFFGNEPLLGEQIFSLACDYDDPMSLSEELPEGRRQLAFESPATTPLGVAPPWNRKGQKRMKQARLRRMKQPRFASRIKSVPEAEEEQRPN